MSGKQIFVLSLVGSFVVLALGTLLARPTNLSIVNVNAGRDVWKDCKEGQGTESPARTNRRTSK